MISNLKNPYYKLGNFFQKIARYFFSRCTGVCWNCGSNCGMNSTMARGYMWCDHCFDRWEFVIRNPKFIFNIRYFGYPRAAPPPAAAIEALREE